MSSKTKEISKDLDTLFKLLRTVEEKTNQNTLDTNTLNSSMQTLIKSVDSFLSEFKNHDANEMEKYTAIEQTNIKIHNRLGILEDDRKEEKLAREKMQKNQDKFFKIMYIGTGIFISFSIIGGLIMFILDLLSKIPN